MTWLPKAEPKPEQIRQDITNWLARLRMWERVSDAIEVERCNERINDLLDQLPRTPQETAS